jgi:hypothetical protein
MRLWPIDDNGQQADAGEADGDNVRHACHTERDEELERGLGTVGGRTQRVETKDG